jgi:hypothetical protein
MKPSACHTCGVKRGSPVANSHSPHGSTITSDNADVMAVTDSTERRRITSRPAIE